MRIEINTNDKFNMYGDLLSVTEHIILCMVTISYKVDLLKNVLK